MIKVCGVVLLSLITLVFAVPASAASLILTWTDNSNNEQGFIVERKAEACTGTLVAFVQLATVGTNVSTFTDSQVTEGTTYCYRVAANNTAGKSAYSNAAGAAVPFTVPAAPSGLGVSVGP
jgi:hypothetical protein